MARIPDGKSVSAGLDDGTKATSGITVCNAVDGKISRQNRRPPYFSKHACEYSVFDWVPFGVSLWNLFLLKVA